MADRVLRGSRLGAVSYETDRNHDLAPRQSMRYACPRGHEFDVPFAERRRGAGDLGVSPARQHLPAGRRRRARAEEGQAAAHALGHAPGAPLGRRPGGAAHRAPGAARRAPRRDRLTQASRGAGSPRSRPVFVRVRTPARSPASSLRPGADRRRPPPQPVPAPLHPPLGDLPQRLGDDRVAHLRRAPLPLGEGDRHLDAPGTRPAAPATPGRPGSSSPATRPRRASAPPAPRGGTRGSRR